MTDAAAAAQADEQTTTPTEDELQGMQYSRQGRPGMADIIANHRERRGQEEHDLPPVEEETEETEAEATANEPAPEPEGDEKPPVPAAEDDKDGEQAEAESDAVDLTLADPNAIVEIKVNGQTHRVTVEDLQRNGQKLLAADQIYQSTLANARQQAGQDDEDGAEDAPEDPDPKANDAALERIVTALQMGDMDEAKEALREELPKLTGAQAPGSPAASPEQIVAFVQDQQALKADREAVGAEYGHIMSDPALMNAAGQEFNTLAHQAALAGETPSRRDLMMTAAKNVDARLRKAFNATTEQPASDPMQKREDRKRGATQHPASATARSQPPAQEARRTRSDIVAEKREARGLA